MNNNNYMLLHPAYLYTGPVAIIKEKAQAFIQQVLCPSGGCTQCFTCLQISTRQHYLVRWLAPSGGYTLAALESVFKTIPFKLDTHEHLFFVLEHADTLSLSCANKLLKSLEEPPAGYHFILLASCQEAILPTVRSRCVIYRYTDESVYEHPLIRYFVDYTKTTAVQFTKELDALKVTEHDYTQVLDTLHNHMLQEYKKALMTDTNNQVVYLEKKLALLQEARALQPMPGSAKIFFKNLFLRFLHLS
jgi:hypothetical protein